MRYQLLPYRNLCTKISTRMIPRPASTVGAQVLCFDKEKCDDSDLSLSLRLVRSLSNYWHIKSNV